MTLRRAGDRAVLRVVPGHLVAVSSHTDVSLSLGGKGGLAASKLLLQTRLMSDPALLSAERACLSHPHTNTGLQWVSPLAGIHSSCNSWLESGASWVTFWGMLWKLAPVL